MAFAFGHVRQLDAVAARLVAELASRAQLLPGAVPAAYIDDDDTIRATYGYAKQGAGYGYSVVKGLNVLIAALSNSRSSPDRTVRTNLSQVRPQPTTSGNAGHPGSPHARTAINPTKGA